MTYINPYHPGGTLVEGSYILRAADEKLRNAILENTLYPYLLAPRQSGKSSILIRTKTEIASNGLEIVIVDLSEFDSKSLEDYEKFIESFIEEIISEFSISPTLRKKITSIRKKPRFFLEGMRAIMEFLNCRLVVCIDEIDKLQQCSFKDVFLGQIRALFNRRTRESNLKRLQFVLAGAVSHEDLISDLRQSPFNVGIAVSLDDLSSKGIQKLVEIGWPSTSFETDEAVKRLLHWTDGSVYLCQEILYRVYKEEANNPTPPLHKRIDNVVAMLIRRASNEIHFRNIERNLKANKQLFVQWLNWIGGDFPDKLALQDLLVIGICSSDKPYKNIIYQRVFSKNEMLSLTLLKKPISILSLEKLIEMELSEYSSREGMIARGYKLDEQGDVIELGLYDCALQSLDFLIDFGQLAHLNVEMNKIEDLRPLKHLPELENAYLGNNIIQSLDGLEDCTNLSVLDLHNNKLQHIDTSSHWPKLKTLNLGGNAWGNAVFDFLINLKNLKHLSLWGNSITQLQFPESTFQIEELYLSWNGIRNIDMLRNFAQLERLTLDFNAIEDISALSSLAKLSYLDLSSNKITNISPLLHLVKRNLQIIIQTEIIGIHDCINISGNEILHPPQEIVAQGNEAIIKYFEEAEKGGLTPLNECKLIFIGDGGVGKTSLMKRIAFNTYTEGEQTTHGINKIAWQGISNAEGQPVKINLWDFGGQHIQHSMHQFFFSERVIYVLVLNPRSDEKEKAAYWLEQIDKLGGNSEIMIVYNWKDPIDKTDTILSNFYELKKKYPRLTHPIQLSCATDDGVSVFRATLEQIILNKMELREAYPTSWYNIKKTVEEQVNVGENYVSYDKYAQWCTQQGYTNETDQKNLLLTLNRIGSIVFFDRPILNHLQILNPEWITTGAYAILTDPITAQKKGHLTRHDLKDIFKAPKEVFSDKAIRIKYTEQHLEFILELLLNYNLCQVSPLNPDVYLIPSAFEGTPKKDYTKYKQGAREYRIQFESAFEMLIMHRLIAKNISNAASGDYWQSGMFMKDKASNTYALIETNIYSSRIEFWIKGTEIRGLWEHLRRDINDIVGLYKNLTFKEEVLYAKDGNNVFLPYQEMLDSLKNSVRHIPYHPSYKIFNIDVLEVLDLFEDAAAIQNNLLKEHNIGNTNSIEFNPKINFTPHIQQKNENKQDINISISLADNEDFARIKDLLLDLKDLEADNQQWQKALISSLDELNRMELAPDKAAQKTSISLIDRSFKKLKDLKDTVAISFVAVDIQEKLPKLLALWETFKHHF